MYSISEIKKVHLEITSLCNAKCPMCARTERGGKTNRHLPLTELSLTQIKKIFSIDFIRQLKVIYLCGNYGDPILAKDLIETLHFFKETNPKIRTQIHTNGGIRSINWWQQLAQVCDEVYFGIDGLEKTSPLYRIGTDFKRVIANASAYIQAGGYAKWQYIVFRHNEHQINEAKKLATEMGFKEFNLKKTGRFFSNTRLESKELMQVLNANEEMTHLLEKPINPQFQNQSLAAEADLVKKHGSLKAYIEKTPIDCKAAAEKSLYISAEGLVFPCCWTANQLYVWYQKPKSNEVWQMVHRLPEGKKSLSALDHSIESIVESDFFQKDFERAWKSTSFKEGKLWVCGKTCGKDFEPFKHQFEKSTTLS